MPSVKDKPKTTPPKVLRKRTRRDARLDLRLPVEAKRVLERAAEMTGVNTSDFVIGAAVEAAERRILNSTAVVMRLDRQESIRAAELLVDPPSPNEELRDLMTADD